MTPEQRRNDAYRERWMRHHPAARRHANADDLETGDLVAWQRRAYRVIDVTERPTHDWPDAYERAYQRHLEIAYRPVERSAWNGRPYMVVIRREDRPKDKPIHLCGPLSHTWTRLPEYYAVCRLCGELPPCHHELTEQEIAKQLMRSDELMDVAPGACLGCAEGITARQKTVAFPGPNLWRPDFGDGSARFHARQACEHWVRKYRKQWDAANPSPAPAAEAELPFAEPPGP